MAINYMANPSDVLWEFMQNTRIEPGTRGLFDYGQLAMALELVSLIKNLESIPVVSEGARQETISTLHTLLTEKGLSDRAYDIYDRLCEWRRPTIQPDSGYRTKEENDAILQIPVVQSDAVPPGIAAFVGPDDLGPPGLRILGAISSLPASPEEEQVQSERHLEWLKERRSPDEPTTYE